MAERGALETRKGAFESPLVGSNPTLSSRSRLAMREDVSLAFRCVGVTAVHTGPNWQRKVLKDWVTAKRAGRQASSLVTLCCFPDKFIGDMPELVKGPPWKGGVLACRRESSSLSVSAINNRGQAIL